ncbi:hypothetical protein [Halarsenatibacter silvermanii]|uniref:Uncharacterized protein n=1 Tax=Halarsenatibacter silvermanii TaxID=321763 RepID=A0A1G9Q0W8_9FIRM|nr:hypothetical protein [Halarsenatibacter silvermanii]SDM04660.1 hypothetical protein SAMN04488692_11510 [Halarsenatibacter silvermanii]
MKDEKGLGLKIFYVFYNNYSQLQEKNEISPEQFSEIQELLDNIEKFEEDKLKNKLQEIFPDYEPGPIPHPERTDSGADKIIEDHSQK